MAGELTAQAEDFASSATSSTARSHAAPRSSSPQARTAPAPHVQIHGASEELAYVLALCGLPLRRLEDVHIPVGGRRFRPTLEDFIEFLQAEGLIRLHVGWQEVIGRQRKRWLIQQTRATVRRDPHNAAEQLRDMGWNVTPPAD